jgi:hypothetical protein
VNQEERNIYQRDFRKKNPEACRMAEKRYYDKNKNVIYPKRRKMWADKYASDPMFHLAHNMRCRIRKALKKGSKGVGTLELIGCDIATLKAHLESLFVPGMAWENLGSVWHIDHKKPCSSFDLSSVENQKLCFNYTNVQPLFVLENLKKGKTCGS